MTSRSLGSECIKREMDEATYEANDKKIMEAPLKGRDDINTKAYVIQPSSFCSGTSILTSYRTQHLHSLLLLLLLLLVNFFLDFPRKRKEASPIHPPWAWFTKLYSVFIPILCKPVDEYGEVCYS